MSAPHAITTLQLENFRNYRALKLDVPPGPIVLVGRNGAGKTNILEALSLLCPGRGLRGATLREIDSRSPSPLRGGLERGAMDNALPDFSPPHLASPARGEEISAPFTIFADVKNAAGTTQIGIGRDAESTMEKRILKINGVKERSQRALTAHVAIQWLTPSMDQVFVEGGTPRRKLLDRITYNFTPEHAERVAGYEHSMRERNRLLADRSRADLYWLSVLEQQMAEHAVAITLARIETIERLKPALKDNQEIFPAAQLSLEGTLENWLAEGCSALDVESKFAERLMTLRVADAARGRANEGPQRSQLKVVHSDTGRVAEQCSTGEQKALLLSIILAAARARNDWCGQPPILLLDEVIAHLDVDKRRALFDLISRGAVQAWMTGTDAADFQGLEANAWHLKIDGGTVEMCY